LAASGPSHPSARGILDGASGSLALAATMLLLTLAALGRAPVSDARTTTLLVGTLILTMILTSPVCHLHYFALAVPLVMGLVVQHVHASVLPGWRLTLLMGAYLAGTALPSLPGMRLLRDGGLAMYAALLLWVVACLTARGRAVE